ncbi:MAG: hypothetical protein J1F03_03690 [Oscillospiraceae bacterium]|nr:hypothetical protein [Oscillospiraceae bacterium]
MIKLDYKFMRLPLFLYLLTVIIFLGILFIYPEVFAIESIGGMYKSDVFYFTDFVFPFLSSAAIIMQLGGTFEPDTFEFIRSLPIKSTPLIRWGRSAAFFGGVNSVCIIFSAIMLKSNIAFSRMYYICFANTVLFLSLALFITLLARQIFYVFCVLYGYALVDLITGGELLGDKSIFINISAQYLPDKVDINRAVIYGISAVCIILSVVVQEKWTLKSKQFKIGNIK